MSRSVDIGFEFTSSVAVSEVLAALETSGWGLAEPAGLSYVIDTDDDWDWQRTTPDRAAKVIPKLDAGLVEGGHVGVIIFHREADTGGQLLFFPGGRSAAFSPTVARRAVTGHQELTDIAWYLDKLVPPLASVGLVSYRTQDLLD